MTKIQKANDDEHHKKGPGNTKEGSKDHKDPTGSDDAIGQPGNSGYEEKQPAKHK